MISFEQNYTTMRFIFFFALSFFLHTVTLNSQTVKLETSSSDIVKDFVPSSTIGIFNDHYIIDSYKTRKNDQGKYTDVFSFVYVNKNSLKIEKKTDLPQFKISGHENYEISTSKISKQLYRDTIELIYRSELSLKKKNPSKYIYSIWRFDAETGSPLTNEPLTVLEIPIEKESDLYSMSFSNEKKFNQYVLKSHFFNKKAKTMKINVKLFDLDLVNTFEKEITLQNISDPSMIDYVYIDKFKNISVVCYSDAYQFYLTEGDFWANIAYLPNNSAEPVITKLHIPNALITSSILMQPDSSGNGKCRVLGMFHSMGNKKAEFNLLKSSTSGIKNFNGGSFVFTVNMAEGEVEKFEQAMLSDNQGRNIWPKGSGGDLDYYCNNQFRAQNIVKVLNDDQKNTYMVVQASYTEQSENIAHFNSNSLIVFKVLPDNTIAWNAVIPRISSQMNYQTGQDPLVYLLNNELHVLFNDKFENIGPIQSMQSGEKLKIKTQADIRNLSPTSIDTTVQLDSWSRQDAVLRHTIIYPDGKWTVNWGELVDATGGSTPPAFEAATFRFEKDSNIGIGRAATNYKNYGNWEFCKIIFQ